MITIVVSTKQKNIDFENMLLKTCGLKDIQLLIYENGLGEFSLTEIYNRGLNESLNEIVVFCHDDIIIKTNNWGKKLFDHYDYCYDSYGILGVAGTTKLSSSGIWWEHRDSMYGKVSHTNELKTWKNEYSRDLGNNLQEVCCVDGVFFSVMKSRLKCNFNEEYKGFHFYDVSFSFKNYLKNVKVGVHTNIEIIHKSIGRTNEKWDENRKQFQNEFQEYLPSTVSIDVSYNNIKVKITNEPKLAIIIPTKNNVDELLIPCLNSLIENTKYQNYTIYVADTGSNSMEKSKIFDYIIDKNQIKLIEYDFYNFAKINNDVVKSKIDSDTELLLFCNNDIEMINDAISIMVDTHIKNKMVGTVGCRLHYEDGTIQHLGMLVQENKLNKIGITHRYLGFDYKNIKISQNIVNTHGNTAAFMLISKNLFDEIDGFNETYVECFEDVELNLTCIIKNKKNITCGNAVCYHLESQTRGKNVDQNDVKQILDFIEKNEKIKNTIFKI